MVDKEEDDLLEEGKRREKACSSDKQAAKYTKTKAGYPLSRVIMTKVVGNHNKVLNIPAYPEKIALLNDVIDRFNSIN